jgi:ubiquinone/menaquinone biosynthesis C-methylase UbiE
MKKMFEHNKPATTMTEKNLSDVALDYGLSESAYSSGYLLRLKYSSFLQETVDWFSRHYLELLPVEAPKVLSLGCGSGIFDLKIIRVIQQQITQQKERRLDFTGLDFNETDLNCFRKSLSDQNLETQSSMTLKYQKFEPSTDLGERYDLITMVHFLHSFDDVLPIIKNALRHVSPGGRLLIVQQKKGKMSELKDTFLDILPNRKFQCTDQIKELLQSERIDFTSHDIDTYFDVSIMNKMSLDTLLLMSFCLSNDLSLLNTQQQNKIRNAFLSLAKVDQDGREMVYESMEAIVC